MSEKWTPGPWAVNGDKIETTYGTLRRRVAIIDDGAGIENPEANANIISAATDMYAALSKTCSNALELGYCRMADCNACPNMAALRKARGEE